MLDSKTFIERANTRLVQLTLTATEQLPIGSQLPVGYRYVIIYSVPVLKVITANIL